MFKDYFSTDSVQYEQYRPRYPQNLFKYLAEISPATEKAWDCACGTGQSAVGLTGHFRKVLATDASRKQLAKAVQCPGLSYRIASAENRQGMPCKQVPLQNS